MYIPVASIQVSDAFVSAVPGCFSAGAEPVGFALPAAGPSPSSQPLSASTKFARYRRDAGGG